MVGHLHVYSNSDTISPFEAWSVVCCSGDSPDVLRHNCSPRWVGTWAFHGSFASLVMDSLFACQVTMETVPTVYTNSVYKSLYSLSKVYWLAQISW